MKNSYRARSSLIHPCIQGCGNIEPTAGHFDLFSPLLSCSHILCIQLSFNLLEIYRTLSCMIRHFHTTGYIICLASLMLLTTTVIHYSTQGMASTSLAALASLMLLTTTVIHYSTQGMASTSLAALASFMLLTTIVTL